MEDMQRTHTGIREHKKVAKRTHPHFLPPSLPPPPTLPHVNKEPRSLSLLLLLVPGSALHTKGRKSPSPTRKPMETQKKKRKKEQKSHKTHNKNRKKKKGVMRSGREDLREDYEGSGINRIRKEKQRQKNIQTQRKG